MREAMAWRRAFAAAVAILACVAVGGVDSNRVERAADIEVEINGDVTTTKYLTTTRPLPTGVLLSSAPTFVSDGTTSEYTTLVIGTVSGGRYSRIVSTAERVFYAIPRRDDRPQPTGVVSEAVNTEVKGGATTIYHTRYIRTSIGSSYGQVIEKTSSVVPQLHSSQEELLPTLTVGEPVHYPTKAPPQLPTQEPVEANEIPSARKVVQGEQVIIVEENVVQADRSKKILPTYTASGEEFALSTPVVIVSNRASFEKTQALLNEKVHKMVKDLNLEEKNTDRESRNLSDLETIEILDLDLALSGSELTTVTYVGFSDFVTTIGSTVVVFMPQSAGAAAVREKMQTAGNFVGPSRSGKVLLTRAPVFIPNGGKVITTTRTFQDRTTTKAVEDPVAVEENDISVDVASPVEAVKPETETNVLSTASTRVFNTIDLYPTGLVTSIGGTVAREKVTTVFTTLVYGTFIKGRYAKVVKSTSSIYYLVSKTDSVQPTAVVRGTPSTVIAGNVGRAVGSSPQEQFIVDSADEAKAALKISQLETSTQPSTAPALFSSQADAEEEKSVLKTYYTTFTFFSTLSSDGSTEVKTSLSTLTSVATENSPTPAVTYYTTSTFFITSTVDGKQVVSTSYSTQSEVVTPTQVEAGVLPSASQKHVTKTYFTTYTYFTTTHDGEKSVVQSRLEVSSNIETVPVPVTESKATPVAETTKAESSPVQYSTGLLSSRMASQVNSGITTVSSTGYFGTFVNGLYAQIIKSTTKTLEASRSSSSSIESLISATRVFSASGSSSLTSSSSSIRPKLSSTPAINRPSSGTRPLLKSSSVVSSSPINILSSLRSQISSSAVQSSRRSLNTNRSFLPFRTSKNRKSGGLLALLAKSGGFAAESESKSKPASPSTKAASPLSTAVKQSSTSSTKSAPLTSSSVPQITPTSRVRGLPSRSRRPFLGLRRPGRPAGLRGLFQSQTQRPDIDEEVEVPVQTKEEPITTTTAKEENTPAPTEEPATEATVETTTEVETTTTKAPRVLAFGRSRPKSGTRNALPLRRRPNEGPRRGLASRFSSVTAGNKEPEQTSEEYTTTAAATTTIATTTTTEAETEAPTEPATESTNAQAAAQPVTDIPRRRQRGRLRGRVARPRGTSSVPFGGRRARGRRPQPVEEVTEAAVEATTTAAVAAAPVVRRVRVRRPGGRRGRLARGRRRRPADSQDLESAGSEFYPEYVAAEPASGLESFSEQNHFLDEAGSEAEEVAYVGDLGAALEVVEAGNLPSLYRTKRQSSFGARNSARAAQFETSSQENVLASLEPTSGDLSGLTQREKILANRRRRKNSGRSKSRQSRQSEIPRARQVSPSPREPEETPRFTLTSDSSRGASRSGLQGDRGSTRSRSNTRRAIPGSRRRRPTEPATAGSSAPKLSLRQRLQQAQLAAASATTSRPISSPRNPSQGSNSRGSTSSSSRSPSRPSSSRDSGGSNSRNRGRRPSLGSIRNRDREPPDPLEIVPTPVLEDGQIIIVSDQQVSASIPVVSNGQTTYKDVFTARTITKTLEYGQYTETEIDGKLRTHLGLETVSRAGGVTEVRTLFIEPTDIKTAIFTPSRVRNNQVRSFASSYIQPGFTVKPEVNTVAASFQPPQQNNNALTALLQQLLAGNQQPLPNPASPLGGFGGGNFGVAQPKPQQAYRTIVFTTTYVTTLTKADATTVPIFFKGRKTNTVIVNSETEVITATEVLTESKPIPGQTVAPAAGLGGFAAGGLLGLTPQQLLLQQLLNRQVRPQLPAIQPTVNMAASQPPQLEELLRQATEASQQASVPAARALPQPESTSVVTIYVSGSRPGEFFTRLSTVTLDAPIEPSRIKRGEIPTAVVQATEIPAYIETDQGLFKIPKDEHIFGDLDFYVMSAMNEIEPDMINLKSTQTLESVKGKSTKYIEKVLDVVPSLTDIASPETNSFLWEGPAEYAPLRREKRQISRGRDRFNGNDQSFAQQGNVDDQPLAGINEPAFITFTYASTLTDQLGNIIVSTTEQALRKLTTQGNIEFVDLTKLNARPTAANNLLFGILRTELDPVARTIAARGSEITSARKTQESSAQSVERAGAASRGSSRRRVSTGEQKTQTSAFSGTVARTEPDQLGRPVTENRNPLLSPTQQQSQTTNARADSAPTEPLAGSPVQRQASLSPLPERESRTQSSITRTGSRIRQAGNSTLAVTNPVSLISGRRTRVRTRVVSENNAEQRGLNNLASEQRDNAIEDVLQPAARTRRVRIRAGPRTSPRRGASARISSESSQESKSDVTSKRPRLGRVRGRGRQRVAVGTTGRSVFGREQEQSTQTPSQVSSTESPREQNAAAVPPSRSPRPVSGRRRRVRVRTRRPSADPAVRTSSVALPSRRSDSLSVRPNATRITRPGNVISSSLITAETTAKETVSDQAFKVKTSEIESITSDSGTVQASGASTPAPGVPDVKSITERSGEVGRFVTIPNEEVGITTSEESFQFPPTESALLVAATGGRRERIRVEDRSSSELKQIEPSISPETESTNGKSDGSGVVASESETPASSRLGSRRRVVTVSRIIQPIQQVTERVDAETENSNSEVDTGDATDVSEGRTVTPTKEKQNTPLLRPLPQRPSRPPTTTTDRAVDEQTVLSTTEPSLNEVEDSVGETPPPAREESATTTLVPRRRVVIRNRSRGRTSAPISSRNEVSTETSRREEASKTSKTLTASEGSVQSTVVNVSTSAPFLRRRVVVRNRSRSTSPRTDTSASSAFTSSPSPSLVSSRPTPRRPLNVLRRPAPVSNPSSRVSSRRPASAGRPPIRARRPLSRLRGRPQPASAEGSEPNSSLETTSEVTVLTTVTPRRRGSVRRPSRVGGGALNGPSTGTLKKEELIEGVQSDGVNINEGVRSPILTDVEGDIGIGTTARKIPDDIESQSGFSNEITGLSGEDNSPRRRGSSRFRKVKTIRRLVAFPEDKSLTTTTEAANTPLITTDSILVNTEGAGEKASSVSSVTDPGKTTQRRRKVKRVKTVIPPSITETSTEIKSAQTNSVDEVNYLLPSRDSQAQPQDTASFRLTDDVNTKVVQSVVRSTVPISSTSPTTQRQRVRVIRTRLVQKTTTPVSETPRRARPTVRLQGARRPSPTSRRRRPSSSGQKDDTADISLNSRIEEEPGVNSIEVRDSLTSDLETTTEAIQVLRKRVRKIRKKIVIEDSDKSDEAITENALVTAGPVDEDEIDVPTTERSNRRGTRRRVVNVRRLSPSTTVLPATEATTITYTSGENETFTESSSSGGLTSISPAQSTSSTPFTSTAISTAGTEPDRGDLPNNKETGPADLVQNIAEGSVSPAVSSSRRRPGQRRPPTRLSPANRERQTTPNGSNRRRPPFREQGNRRQNTEQENDSTEVEEESSDVESSLDREAATTTESTRGFPGRPSRGRRPSLRTRPSRRPRPPRPQRPSTTSQPRTTTEKTIDEVKEILATIDEDEVIGENEFEQSAVPPRRPPSLGRNGNRNLRPTSTRRPTTESPTSTTSRRGLLGIRRPFRVSALSGTRPSVSTRTRTEIGDGDRSRERASGLVRRPSIFSRRPDVEEVGSQEAFTSSTTTTTEVTTTTSEATTARYQDVTDPPETSTAAAATTRRAPFFPGLRLGSTRSRTRNLFAGLIRNAVTESRTPTVRTTRRPTARTTRRPTARTTRRPATRTTRRPTARTTRRTTARTTRRPATRTTRRPTDRTTRRPTVRTTRRPTIGTTRRSTARTTLRPTARTTLGLTPRTTPRPTARTTRKYPTLESTQRSTTTRAPTKRPQLPTRRPFLGALRPLQRPSESSLSRDNTEEIDLQLKEKDGPAKVIKTNAGVSTANFADILPHNVVYKQFSTISLVEILGGRQTLTLSVLTSTLTTLAPSELHLTTDAPWLFDGTSPSTTASVTPTSVIVQPTATSRSVKVSQTRVNSAGVVLTTQTTRESSRTSSSRRKSSVIESARSTQLLSSTWSRISPSRSSTATKASSRDQKLLFTLRASSSINSSPSIASRVIPKTQTALVTEVLKTVEIDSVPSLEEDRYQTTTSKKPEDPVQNAEDTVNQEKALSVKTTLSVQPVVQGTLFDPTDDAAERPADGLDIIRELLAINSVTATPVLDRTFLQSTSSTPTPSTPVPSLITSSGTVVIFAELITKQAVEQRIRADGGNTPGTGVSRDVTVSPLAAGIATRVMDNGVPVLVAGGRLPQEQVVSNGQVVLNSGTLTLPALPLSDRMSLSPSVETDPSKLYRAGAVPALLTKTYLATVTLLTSRWLSSGRLVLDARRRTDALVVTEPVPAGARLAAAPQFLTRGTDGFDLRYYRTHTYYTTFTFLNHFKENDKTMVVTSRKTVSNVLTLPAAAVTPSSTRFQTETYLTTYTYYKTTTEGDKEQIASTKEVVTQIVVTEAPVTAPAAKVTPTRSLLFTKTYLSTVTLFDTAIVSGEQVIVSSTSVIKDVAIETSYFANVRPTATRPPIHTTAAPQQKPSALPTPVVDSSLLPVGEQDEIHVVATRTFYTTSTFYTTLLEGSSTVVRTRTEITSRVQTEKVTTRLDPSHLISFRGSLSASAPSSTRNPSVTQTGSKKPFTLTPSAVQAASTPAVDSAEIPEPAATQESSQLTAQEAAAVDLKDTSNGVDRVGGVSAKPTEPAVPTESAATTVNAEGADETADPALLSASSSPSADEAALEENSLVTASSDLNPTTVTPDPLTGASSPDGGTSSTAPSPETPNPTESTAASLGNLAGSLLGLSGLAASGLNLGSMVDTAAGLIRNVLPLSVRREDTQSGRPPPAVHVQQRNPSFIPIGGVGASLRRKQQTAPAPGGGLIVVRGPNGQLIPVRGLPNDGPQQLRPGAPNRRVERPRRPGPGGGPPRAGQKLPPLNLEGVRRPGRPQRPNRRKQPQHVARPNGFIAVFPGQDEPPHQQNGQQFNFEGGFHGQDVNFPSETQGGFVKMEHDDQRPGEPFHINVRPGLVQGSQQRVEFTPGGQPRPRPGLEPPSPQELTPMFEGPDFHNPSMEHFGAADGRRPFPSGGFLHEFRPGTSTRVRVSITTGVQTQFISPSSAGPQGEVMTAVPVPRPVVVVGASVPPGFGEQEYEETSQLDQAGVQSGTAPSYVDGEFADLTNEDDQDYAASVQGPFGATQLTYFGPDDTGFERPDVEQNIRQPIDQYIPEQTFPMQQQPPVRVQSTLQTIAQLEGSNRIVGTNVFANVVPITTKPAIITISFPQDEDRRRPPAPVLVPVRPRYTSVEPQSTRQLDPISTVRVPTYIIEEQTEYPATSLPNFKVDFEPEFTTELSTEEEGFVSKAPSIPEVDLDLAASTEQAGGRPRQEQTSSSIIGDEENEKINFILSSSFDEVSATSPPLAGNTESRTGTPATRLADRIRQTLLASLSSVAAEAAGSSTSRIQSGASTAILGPDVRTLVADTRVTSRPGGTETVIEGESTVFSGLFTRPALPVHNVHDITEIVNGPGQQPVTKYITRTEQLTRTVTATKTDIRFEGSSVITSTKIITSTLPPITIVSTVVGTSTQVHTLNTATPTRVRPLSTSSRLRPLPPPPPPRRPHHVAIAAINVPDNIDLNDIRTGVSDDNEVNRVVISPGVGQGLVVEQAEAVATLCQRPCLPDIFETCRRVGDQHRCACRPGYSRVREQDPCEPTLTYRLHLLLDRVNDIPLSFRPPFGDPDSAEYRQMSQLTETGLVKALGATPLSERLHTARLMRFQRGHSAGGLVRRRQDGLLAEMMLQVSDRRSQPMDRMRLEQTLQQALRSSNYSLGGQNVIVSRQNDAATALDFDECEDTDYNDCHTQAYCYNLVGTFTCSCRDGMVDADVTGMPGRTCSAESAGCEACSYSGECYTRDDGGTGCRCHRWYAGNRCQINLRVLLIALVTVGVVLALLLCACCFLCCRRRGRAHTAPPLVFTGPAGFLRHRGTSLSNAILDRRAMLDSSSDTSAPSPPRRMAVSGGKRSVPVPPSRGRRSGAASGSFQEDRSMASTGIRPPVFIPRAKHKHPTRPNSAASSAVCVGADASADLRSSQSRLLSVLEPVRRGRVRAGTLTSQRTSRSVSSGRRLRGDVSQVPSGRSRSSDNLSQRAQSLAEAAEYGSHAFFRERTMSEARSFDETTIRPTVRSVRGCGTQRSQLSSRALSSNQNTYDHHTMAERDASSTFVTPETQLFRSPQDPDAQSELSLARSFLRSTPQGADREHHSTAGSRRNHR